jgi:hypothetical protein
MATMWRSIRWSINLVVLAFAAYAFCVVPLGERTGLEHARAILASDAAKDAKAEVVEAARKLDAQVRGNDADAGSATPSQDAPPSTDDAKSYDGPVPGAPLQRTTPAAGVTPDPALVQP